MRPLRIIPAVLVLGAAALAQPPRQEPPPAPPGAPRETDAAAMKARLERWLEETRHREELIQAALKRLSEGASPDEVRKGMEPGMRLPRPGGRDAQGRPGEPGGRPRQGGPGHEGQRPEPFDREQVLGFIQKQNAEMGARMRAMAHDNPEIADRILSRIAPQVREVMAERDDQTREIRTAQLKNGWEVMGAVREIRDAVRNSDDAAKAKGVQHVRDLLGVGFDLRVRLHEREVAVLEERLAKLKQELADERSGRETFIADRLKQATEPHEHHEPRPNTEPKPKP